MVEWLAAVKVKAAFAEGVRSIVVTGSKELATRAASTTMGSKSKVTADLFSENGPVSGAILPLTLSGPEKEALSAFLNSELFSTLLKSSAAVALSKNSGSRQQFSNLLLHYMEGVLPNKAVSVLDNFCRELSQFIIEASEEAWNEVTEIGFVNPIEAALTSAQSLVAGEIANINAQLTDSIQFSLERLKEYEHFEKRYRKEIGLQHGKLRPATLNDAKETPIDKIYVASHLRAQSQQSPDSEPIDRVSLLKSSFRTVILGTPGGGKSTFASKLCSDLYLKYQEHIYGGRALSPVLVVLKDYAKYRKQHPCSIVEFVTLRCKADLQIEPPEGAIRYLFLTGRAMVIFDGLDELLETADRVDIKLAVEHFTNQYPVVPILVTSREVGYEQAPLDKDMFRVFRLEPFNQEQVEEYVVKWFAINRLPGVSREDSIAKAFMRDSSAVPDLRQNPLMLSLLCSLYKLDGYLPSNRPAVYKRCADLLFETWDKGRDIVVNLPLDRKLRPAMANLAHWIYSDSTLQGGVNETTLVAETAKYLSKWCADIEEAQGTAEKFIGFFRGRAWVFSDTGSSKSQSLYQFTHRTFLEFFTAEHLVKSYGSVHDLTRYLLPRLLAREWDVVCQLVYQMCSEASSASDELVAYLLEDAIQQNLIGRLRLASFLARTLDFIFPTRQMRVSAIIFCVQSIIEALEISRQERVASETGESKTNAEGIGEETLEALMTCSIDMLALHATEFSDRIIAYINSAENNLSRANALTCIDFFDATISHPDEAGSNAYATAWREAKKKISEATVNSRVDLSAQSVELAISSWWEQKLDIEDLVAMHGTMSVFRAVGSPLQQWWRVGIADSIVNNAISSEREEKDPYILQEARKLPGLLLVAPHQWLNNRTSISYWGWHNQPPKWPKSQELRQVTLLLIAAGGMSGLKPNGEFAKEVLAIIESRGNPNRREEANRIIKDLHVGEATEDLMRKWIEGLS